MTVDQYKALANRSYATGASGGTIEFASDVSSADTSGVTFANGITYVLSSGDNTVSLGDSGITLKTQGSGTNTITLGSGADVLTLASTGEQTVSGTLTSGDTITATTAVTFSGSSATFDIAAGGVVSGGAVSENTIPVTLSAGGSSSTPLYNGDLSALGTISGVTVGSEATDSTYMTLTAGYTGQISAAGALYVTASGSSAIALVTVVTTGNDVESPYSGSSGGLKGATVAFTASANGDSALIDASSEATVVGGSGSDTFMLKSSVAENSTATFDVDLGTDGKSDHVYLSWGETLAGKVVVNLEGMEFGTSGDTTNVLSTALESLTKANALGVLQGAFSDLSNAKVADVTAYALGLGTEVSGDSATAKLFSIDGDVYAIHGVMSGNALSDASGNSDASFGDGEIAIKLTGAAKGVTDSTTLVNNVRSALIGTDLNALGDAPIAAVESTTSSTGSETTTTSILKFSSTSENSVTVGMSGSGSMASVQEGSKTAQTTFTDLNGDTFTGTLNGVDFTGLGSSVTGKVVFTDDTAGSIGSIDGNSGSGGLLGETIELTAGTGGVTAYVNATKSATLTGSASGDTFMLVSSMKSGEKAAFTVDLGSDTVEDDVLIQYGWTMSGSATIEIKNLGLSNDKTNIASSSVESLTKENALTLLKSAFSLGDSATISKAYVFSGNETVLVDDTDSSATANLFTIGSDSYAVVGSGTGDSTLGDGEIAVKLTGIAAGNGENADSTFVTNILGFMGENAG